jgi:hypothetical protein
MIKTPLGEFPSIIKAAAAHRVDRHTMSRRFKADPKNYQYLKPNLTTKLVSWSEYRLLPFETKEELYAAWCQTQKLDPDLEDTANTFFDHISGLSDTVDSEEVSAED